MLIDLVKCINTRYCGENIQKKKRVDCTENKKGSEFSYDSKYL